MVSGRLCRCCCCWRGPRCWYCCCCCCWAVLVSGAQVVGCAREGWPAPAALVGAPVVAPVPGCWWPPRQASCCRQWMQPSGHGACRRSQLLPARPVGRCGAVGRVVPRVDCRCGAVGRVVPRVDCRCWLRRGADCRRARGRVQTEVPSPPGCCKHCCPGCPAASAAAATSEELQVPPQASTPVRCHRRRQCRRHDPLAGRHLQCIPGSTSGMRE